MHRQREALRRGGDVRRHLLAVVPRLAPDEQDRRAEVRRGRVPTRGRDLTLREDEAVVQRRRLAVHGEAPGALQRRDAQLRVRPRQRRADLEKHGERVNQTLLDFILDSEASRTKLKLRVIAKPAC